MSKFVVPASNPGAYMGVTAANPPEVVQATRAPTTTDVNYNIGDLWINTTAQASYELAGFTAGAAAWVALGGGAAAIATINSNAPVGGNYTLAGTANQISKAETAGTTTFSLPAAITAPGSLTTTTTLASGTTLTAGTGLTVTTGAATLTNGNLVFGTAGNKILSTSVATTTAAGANSFGSVTLVNGTATVATTAVTANSLIYIWRQSIGATGAAALGQLTIGTITAATSFVITAALTATATSTATTDVSVVGWMIVN